MRHTPLFVALCLSLAGFIGGCTADPEAPDASDAPLDTAPVQEPMADYEQPPVEEEFTYETYANERFGYEMAYPPALLEAQPEAQNADGRRFVSPEETVSLRVFGRNRVGEETHRERYEANREAMDSTSYAVFEDGFFVVSGRRGERIVYVKMLWNDTVEARLELGYPASRQASLEPVVARIAESFVFTE